MILILLKLGIGQWNQYLKNNKMVRISYIEITHRSLHSIGSDGNISKGKRIGT